MIITTEGYHISWINNCTPFSELSKLIPGEALYNRLGELPISQNWLHQNQHFHPLQGQTSVLPKTQARHQSGEHQALRTPPPARQKKHKA